MTGHSAIEGLLAIAGRPLGNAGADLDTFSPVEHELRQMLLEHNGFFAFESALLVRPMGPDNHALDSWNRLDGWRAAFGEMTEGLLFFAEDILGVQFAIRDDTIHRFDSETGESERFASTLEEWAERILDDYEYLTGHPLAHAWQERHGPIPLGMRLMPVLPFSLGGSYTLENLRLMHDAEAMALRGSIAAQLSGLPDGTRVKLRRKEDN